MDEPNEFPVYTIDVAHFEPLVPRQATFVGTRKTAKDEAINRNWPALEAQRSAFINNIRMVLLYFGRESLMRIDSAQRHGPSLPSVTVSE